MGARPPLARAMALRGQGPPMAALNGSDALQAPRAKVRALQRRFGLWAAFAPSRMGPEPPHNPDVALA